MVQDLLVVLAFVLMFVFPGVIYYFVKVRKMVATCEQQRRDIKQTKKIIAGVVCIGITLLLSLYTYIIFFNEY